mgnify:CR=1 FL=1|jgi:hypothetical protein
MGQVKICLRRGFWRLKADPSLTLFQLFGNFVMALIVSSVFYNLAAVGRGDFPAIRIVTHLLLGHVEFLLTWLPAVFCHSAQRLRFRLGDSDLVRSTT